MDSFDSGYGIDGWHWGRAIKAGTNDSDAERPPVSTNISGCDNCVPLFVGLQDTGYSLAGGGAIPERCTVKEDFRFVESIGAMEELRQAMAFWT
ncbi:unnamed protein product [Echinostoma caproni]|uniref:Peptidase M20 n=1 Tax=Echinostoma caproni TaxID=27848 RepID=A0A183AI18_9TREM|nr:unnamed protein product [Echinostoma caproni]